MEAKKEFINELNVFPVPDGDTGTNMSMTIMSAAKEVSAMEDRIWNLWQGDFFRFSSRSQRKLGSNPFPASERIYKDDPGRERDRCDCIAQACSGQENCLQGGHETERRDDPDSCKRNRSESS